MKKWIYIIHIIKEYQNNDLGGRIIFTSYTIKSSSSSDTASYLPVAINPGIWLAHIHTSYNKVKPTKIFIYRRREGLSGTSSVLTYGYNENTSPYDADGLGFSCLIEGNYTYTVCCSHDNKVFSDEKVNILLIKIADKF